MQKADVDIFRQIGDQSKDVYFLFDVSQSKFVYLNSAFESIWQISQVDVLTTPVLIYNTILAEDKELVQECYEECIKEREPRKYEFRILCPDETKKYICISIYPIGNPASNIIAGIAEDITVLKRNIFYMEKINARKNSTLEILAHDLKGPLGMISLLASSIQREALADSKDGILQSVQYIQDMCNRNIALIRNLVNSEFLESTEVDLRKERTDLVWEINDVIQNYKRHEDNLAKTFILNTTTEKLYLYVDTLKFMQVVNNLISNAIKFTPDNGVIEIEIQDLKDTAVIMVRDNGIGIPEDVQPYLFDKFTRARRNGLRGEQPVGLGMSIIKTIVDLHNGKISFKSNEGEGSAFYIEIPKQ
ncbi:PAS domain-containing sensor histidine kinase [Mucilaginibacter lacusdianchii]|uniref:PAS domain-containing sensor histidine kinase n=1 Tax=Mucilaginibacter lacusdianchii TaxID=2684211 RepID=UPI00131DA4E5|nr:PAS domain-containing sensor histidine kinase [Mucilaginibacter sp. JXJ CY 39]